MIKQNFYGIWISNGSASDNSGSHTYHNPVVEYNYFYKNNIQVKSDLSTRSNTTANQQNVTMRYNKFQEAISVNYQIDRTLGTYGSFSPTISDNIFIDATKYGIKNNVAAWSASTANNNYWGSSAAEWDIGPQPAQVLNMTIVSSYSSTSQPLLSDIFSSSLTEGEEIIVHGANFAAGDLNIVGNGQDGSATVNSSIDLNSASIGASSDGNGSYADGYALRVSGISGTVVTVSDSADSAFVPGDFVLLINLQGISGDYGDVGNYEVLTVSTVSGTSITLATAPVNTYDGSADSFTNQYVVIQRIPQYENITVSSGGVITASSWDRLATAPSGFAGMPTGIVAFAVNGTLTIDAGGKVDASGLGFQGVLSTSTGESIISSVIFGPNANTANIGGGGQNTYVGPTCWNNGNFGGGGGGGHGAAGQTPAVPTNDGATLNGLGGDAYGVADLSRLFFGSAGGNCYAPYCGAPYSVPGSGGGIVLALARNLINNGSIENLGTNATNLNDCCGGTKSGGAGGGAGGAIKIVSAQVTAGSLLATGGSGGLGPTRLIWACGPGEESTRGGSGAVGIIAIISSSVSGVSANPAPYIGN